MTLDGILRVLAVPLLLTSASATLGQPAATPPSEDWALRPTVPSERPEVPACGAQAAMYAAGGLKLWVTRIGTMTQDNPLRPLSPDRHLVLQVSVNGRVASAYGPDFDHLRQGGSPQKLEEASGSRIQWESVPDKLPASIRVVREDGTVLLGPLTFETCGDAPRTPGPAAPASRAPAKSAPRPAAPAEKPRLPPPGLPQGAIQ